MSSSKHERHRRCKNSKKSRKLRVITVRRLTQLGAWSVLLRGTLYGVCREQEVRACTVSARPSVGVIVRALQHAHRPETLRLFPDRCVNVAGCVRGVYSGLFVTAALQPLVYPTSVWLWVLQQHLNTNAMQAQMLSGAVLVAVCAPWKTWILGQQRAVDERISLAL